MERDVIPCQQEYMVFEKYLIYWSELNPLLSGSPCTSVAGCSPEASAMMELIQAKDPAAVGALIVWTNTDLNK